MLALAPPPVIHLPRAPGSDPPARAGAMAPNLARGHDAVHLTWLEPSPPGSSSLESSPPDSTRARRLRLRIARFAHGEWSEARTIVESDEFLANWADLPSVVVAADGSLVAHWPQKSGSGTYAYDVMLSRSIDAGRTWNHLGPAHQDGTETEHGFVSLVPDGPAARGFWLDGREMVIDEDAATIVHPPGAMTLRTAARPLSVCVRKGEVGMRAGGWG